MQLNQVTDAEGPAVAAVAAVAAAVVAKSVRHRQIRERGQFEAEKGKTPAPIASTPLPRRRRHPIRRPRPTRAPGIACARRESPRARRPAVSGGRVRMAARRAVLKSQRSYMVQFTWSPTKKNGKISMDVVSVIVGLRQRRRK